MDTEVPREFRVIHVVAPIMAVFMACAFAVPFVLMIRSLRSMKVRAAVERAAMLPQAGRMAGAAWAWGVYADAPESDPSPLLIYPSYADPPPHLRYAGPGQYGVLTGRGAVRLGTAPGTVVAWDPDTKKVTLVADTWNRELADNTTAVDAFVDGLMACRDG